MKKTIPLIIVLLLFASFALGQEDPAAAFKDNPTPENFNELPNPTSEDLIRVANPTPENFNKLLNYNPNEAATYLNRKYNNDFALTFYKDVHNVGKNSDLDRKYFAGKYTGAPSTASRDNIRGAPQAAQKYFLQTHKAKYTFDNVADDFVYDPTPLTALIISGASITNGGKTIFLSQYENKKEILDIKTTQHGIVIVRANEELTFSGTGQGQLQYDGQQFRFKDRAGTTHKISRLKTWRKESINFNIDSQDTITLTGRANLFTEVNGRTIKVRNRVGTITLPKNGLVSADNAEYTEIDGRLYFDGKFDIQTDQRTSNNPYGTVQAKIYSLSSADKLGRNSRTFTRFVDTTTKIGAVSQGQQQGQEAVSITLQKLDPKAPGIQIPTASEKSALIDSIKARSRGDLGKNGNVIISADPSGRRHSLIAEGKVTAGYYHVGKDKLVSVFDQSRPRFIGKDGQADFAYERDSGIELFQLRGKAIYRDGQLSKAENIQDGSIFRKYPSGLKNTDVFEVECQQCSSGQKITKLSKRYSVSSGSGTALSFRTGDLNVDFTKTNTGFKATPYKKSLGELSSDDLIAFGKNFYVKDDQNNNFYGLSSRGVGRYEKVKDGRFVSTSLDLGLKSRVGGKLIIVSEQEEADLNRLMTALQQGQLQQIPNLGLQFDNPDLQKLVKKELQLDLFHLNNEEYIEKYTQAVQSFDPQDTVQALGSRLSLLEAEKIAAAEEDRDTLQLEAEEESIHQSLMAIVNRPELLDLQEQMRTGPEFSDPEFFTDRVIIQDIQSQQAHLRNKISEDKAALELIKLKLADASPVEKINLVQQREKIQRRIEVAQTQIRFKELEAQDLANEYANSRPDIAAQICGLGRNADCEKRFSQSLAVIAPDKYIFHQAQAAANLGDLPAAKVLSEQIQDPEQQIVVQEMVRELQREEADRFQDLADDAQRNVAQAVAEFEEERSSWTNTVFLNLGRLFNKPDKLNEDRAMGTARTKELNARITSTLINLEHYPEEIIQLSPEQIKSITGITELTENDLREYDRYLNSPEFRIIAGETVSDNDLAEYHWDQMQLDIQAAHLEESAGYDRALYLAQNFPNTIYGQDAIKLLNKIEAGEAYSTTGSRIIFSVVDWTLVAGAAVKGLQVASKAAQLSKYGRQAAVLGTRATEFIEGAGKVITTSVRAIGKLPGIRQARAALRTPTAKIFDEAIRQANSQIRIAERTLQEARVAGSATQIQRAEVALQSAQADLVVTRNIHQAALAVGESESIFQNIAKKKETALGQDELVLARRNLDTAAAEFKQTFSTGGDIVAASDKVLDAKKNLQVAKAGFVVRTLQERSNLAAQDDVQKAINNLPPGHTLSYKCASPCKINVIGKTGEEVVEETRQLRRTLVQNGLDEDKFARGLLEETPLSQGQIILGDGEGVLTSARSQAAGNIDEGLPVSELAQEERIGLTAQRGTTEPSLAGNIEDASSGTAIRQPAVKEAPPQVLTPEEVNGQTLERALGRDPKPTTADELDFVAERGDPNQFEQSFTAAQKQAISGDHKKMIIRQYADEALGTPKSQQLENEMLEIVYKDQYGADKLAVFESKVHGRKGTIFEISTDRPTMKRLNGENYRLGDQAIDSQHSQLLEYARDNGLDCTTLQKTTLCFLPADSSLSVQQMLNKIQDVEQGVSQSLQRPFQLRVGLAENKANLMEVRLQTRRSIVYSTENNLPPTKYGIDVEDWYNNLPLAVRNDEGVLVSGKAYANDIFRGYDPRFLDELNKLESLRGNPEAFREQLIKLSIVDPKDINFVDPDIVKSNLFDATTGLKEGDLSIARDGVKLGSRNQDDIERVTRESLLMENSDKFIAENAGVVVDSYLFRNPAEIKKVTQQFIDNLPAQSVSVLEEASVRARAYGYYRGNPNIQNMDELKDFLKWEVDQLTWKGGDEAFTHLRATLAEANPDIGQQYLKVIDDCGPPCGFQNRIGIKQAGPQEEALNVISASDEATILSKRLDNQVVYVDEFGLVHVGELPLEVPLVNPEIATISETLR